jgi:hypothetical protein
VPRHVDVGVVQRLVLQPLDGREKTHDKRRCAGYVTITSGAGWSHSPDGSASQHGERCFGPPERLRGSVGELQGPTKRHVAVVPAQPA